MPLSRRQFMRNAQAVGLFYTSFAVAGYARAHTANAKLPLVSDPEKMLDLPEGFTYTLVSKTGGKMSDGFLRPGQPEGMACFAHPTSAGKCILMRNHENWNDITGGSPFGSSNELLRKLDLSKLYDKKADGSPFFGGVTKVIYDLKNNKLERDFLVFTGTAGNCAGGATPWGSWLSCEEEMLKPSEGPGKYHGFVFETPVSSMGLVDPVPLKDMGRFAHEAAAVDPETGIVYLTEDRRTGRKTGAEAEPAGSNRVKNSKSCGSIWKMSKPRMAISRRAVTRLVLHNSAVVKAWLTAFAQAALMVKFRAVKFSSTAHRAEPSGWTKSGAMLQK